MSLWFIISLIMLCFIGFHQGQKAQKTTTALPFPPLTDFQVSDIGKPVHIFEGIDYDKLPRKLRYEYNDCYGDRNKCLRLRTQFNPVCGYDARYKMFFSYINYCELELQNCLVMTVNNDNQNYTKYGVNYWDRKVYFLGEGPKCEHYVRRFNRIMKFGKLNTTVVNATTM